MGIAQTQNNLGNLYSKGGKMTKAEQAYEESLTTRRRLAESQPEVIEYQKHLAETQNNLGVFYIRIGKKAEAGQAFLEAITLTNRLAAQQPGILEYAVLRGWTYNNLGRVLRDKPQEALACYAQAIHGLGAVLERDPRQLIARRFLGSAHYNRGVLWNEIGQHADMRRRSRNMIALSNSTTVNIALTFARDGPTHWPAWATMPVPLPKPTISPRTSLPRARASMIWPASSPCPRRPPARTPSCPSPSGTSCPTNTLPAPSSCWRKPGLAGISGTRLRSST